MNRHQVEIRVRNGELYAIGKRGELKLRERTVSELALVNDLETAKDLVHKYEGKTIVIGNDMRIIGGK